MWSYYYDWVDWIVAHFEGSEWKWGSGGDVNGGQGKEGGMGRDWSGQQVSCVLYAATSTTNAPPLKENPDKLAHEVPRMCERLKQILDVPRSDGTHLGGATILHVVPTKNHMKGCKQR